MSASIGITVGALLMIVGVIGLIFRRKFGALIVAVNDGVFPLAVRRLSRSIAGDKNEGEVLAAILSVGWIAIGLGVVLIVGA